MSSNFTVNSIIEWLPLQEDDQPLLERVLWIDSSGENVVVISLSDDNALPVWKTSSEIITAIADELAIRRTVDPFARLASPHPEYLKKHIKRMERAWEVIENLVTTEPDIYHAETRGKLIQQTLKRLSIQKVEVYKFLRRYWRAGKFKYALLPSFDRCGGPGQERDLQKENNDQSQPKRGRPPKTALVDPENVGINVDNEIKNLFKICVKLYYDKKQKNPAPRAYNLMIDSHFNVGFRTEGGAKIPILPPPSQLPTLRQFRYWCQKHQDLEKSLKSREGARSFNLNSRPILGNSTQMAFGPGSIFQVDATIGDIYLVSSLNRAWIIGRPVVYMVIDVFSRMIVGLYVGLEGPSWIGAMMALANAASDKVAFCADYGIEISPDTWPCHCLPEMLLADRGEFLGINADNLAYSLGIDMANCPPYRADWKGIVEQSFRRVNLKSIKWLPGSVRKREQGEKDHRLDATLDLQQFTKIMIYTALDINLNHRMDDYPQDKDLIRDSVEPIPIDLWEWGIKHRVGHLREKSPEIVKLNLMPRGTATVTAKGIKFEGMYYSTDRALHEQWYIHARREGTWNIPVCYDPRKVEVIYLCTGNNSNIEPCNLLPKDERFQNHMLEEILDYYEIQTIREKQHEGRRMQSGAEHRAHVSAIEEEAIEITHAANPNRLSVRERLNGIRGNRKNEKELNRSEEAFDLRTGRTGDEPGAVLPFPAEDMNSNEKPDTPHLTTVSDRKKNFLAILKNDNEGETKR